MCDGPITDQEGMPHIPPRDRCPYQEQGHGVWKYPTDCLGTLDVYSEHYIRPSRERACHLHPKSIHSPRSLPLQHLCQGSFRGHTMHGPDRQEGTSGGADACVLPDRQDVSNTVRGRLGAGLRYGPGAVQSQTCDLGMPLYSPYTIAHSQSSPVSIHSSNCSLLTKK